LQGRGKIPNGIIERSNLEVEERRMKLTPGKRKGLEAVSDSRGVIAAAAMDQRGSLKSAIAKRKASTKRRSPIR
jgi:hypothetical protein